MSIGVHGANGHDHDPQPVLTLGLDLDIFSPSEPVMTALGARKPFGRLLYSDRCHQAPKFGGSVRVSGVWLLQQ